MEVLEVNDKPAVKIKAEFVRKSTNSGFFNCEGDYIWIPKKCYKIVDDETILIQEWFYNKKLETGEL